MWDRQPPPDHRNYIQPKPVCRVEMLSIGKVEYSLDLADAQPISISPRGGIRWLAQTGIHRLARLHGRPKPTRQT